MKTKSGIIAVLFAAVSLMGAFALPEAPSYRPAVIITGIPGPEDFAVYEGPDGPRILVSSDERLDPRGTGAVYSLDPETGLARPMERIGEPAGLSFHPHGVDVVDRGGTILLYVIVHRKEGEGAAHGVAVYEVSGVTLRFVELLEDPLLVSPNDLSVTPGGVVYVTNDSSGKGGFAETLLGLRRSTVVRYDGKGGWSVAARRLGMANGILVDGDTAYVAATRQHAVYRYTVTADGGFTGKERLARVKGPDNIMQWDGFLLVAAHTKTLALVRHMSDQAKPSPSVVFAVDPSTGETRAVYADDGNTISAASTAAFVGGDLFIGQIVAPFMVKARPE